MHIARRRQVQHAVRVVGVAASWLIASWAATPLLAQPAVGDALPCTLAAAERVDAAAEAQIRSFVERQVDMLDGDHQAQSRARDLLMEPLACQPVGVSFRLKYSEIAEPLLTPLVNGENERVAVNALRVAARLRTTGSLRPIEAGLASKSAAVRYGASAAARDLFAQLAVDSFGFPENSVDRLMDRLATTLTTETDPIVGDGLVLALCDGPSASAALRNKGASRVNPALAVRVKSLRAEGATGAAWVDVTYRALDASRLTILEQIAAGGAEKAVATSAAVLGGQALALARDRMKSGSEADRAAMMRLVNAAEITMVVSHNAITGQKVGEKALQRAFEAAASSGDAGQFATAIDSWIGASGLLTKAPYSANAADFASK